MNKIKLFGVALVAVMFLASCGGGENKEQLVSSESNEVEINSEQSEPSEPKILNTISYTNFKIGSRDKAYFKMVENGKTEIVLDERGFAQVTAEFELIKTYTGNAQQYFVALIAKDEKGKTIFGENTGGEMRSNDSDGSQFLDFMLSEPGEIVTFVFTGSISQKGTFNPDIEETKKAVKKISSFKVKTEAN